MSTMPQPELDKPLSMDNLKADSEEQKEHQAAKLSLEDIKKLGTEAEELETQIQLLLDDAAMLTKKRDTIMNETLPRAMIEIGIKDFTLMSGVGLELYESVNASINDENRPVAHQWLRDNNHGDLIKTVLTATFGKGEEKYATLLQETIAEMRKAEQLKLGAVETKEAVHASTLKAFIKRELEEGTAIPAETFKLFFYNTVNFVKPKKKKI